MKPFLTLICAATLVGAPFAAQSAPADDAQRVVAELLRMAQERNAAGDAAMARALAEQAARMMGGPAGAPAAGALAVPGERIQYEESFAPLQLSRTSPNQEELRALEFGLGEPMPTLEWVFQREGGSEFVEGQAVELQRARVQDGGLGGLQALGYTSIPAAPAQDDLQANLRAIRQELQALRAEVGALRAEIAGRHAGGQHFGGGNMLMPAPNGALPQGGYMFYGPGQPAPQGQPGQQPQHYYYHEGAPAAPGAGNGAWQTPQGGFGAPPPPAQAPAAGPRGPGGAGVRQRTQARAEAHAAAEAAAAVATARDAQAAAEIAARDGHAAHAAALDAHQAALQALHGALNDAARANQPPAPPAPPAVPAVPRDPRSGGGGRPQNLR